ncbi:MAG: cysteine rich repeat-containing protein [Xanthobacteraceae bacterium]
MIRKIAILLAVTIVGASTASAQLPLPLPIPSGTPEDRAACEPDVHRYCKSAIPDNLRVLACLQANRQRIGRTCQAVLVKYGQ